MTATVAVDSVNIIFDLDGTLIDSQPGIFESLKLALADSGFSNDLTIDQVPVGPPLQELIQLITNCSDLDTINLIMTLFKRYYDTSCFKSSPLFHGVLDFLISLHRAQFNLFIATNKRLTPTLKILEYLSIDSIFKDVYAVDSFDCRFSSKASMLNALISCYSLGSNTIYIGDRYDDFLAAEANSIRFYFPKWGYTADHHLFSDNAFGIDFCSPFELYNLF
ncbi:MAG: hypothetical protein ED554_06735 [Synechococcus sp. YX04-3]|nr:MAG: hypothetical protein ED554_06735 [Synechococcus sp. YX04-3]